MDAWNPIIELEQLTIPSFVGALDYWRDLIPISERWQQNGPLPVTSGAASKEELVRLKILAEKAFLEELEDFWRELKQKVGEAGRILYLDFVGSDTYSVTLDRAYMTSFLVTYGYATLELVPLEEEIFIIPFIEPKSGLADKQMVSIPISVNYKEWMKWKEENRR